MQSLALRDPERITDQSLLVIRVSILAVLILQAAYRALVYFFYLSAFQLSANLL
jgi:hypothetical protein